jgi:hypothetical protein
MSKRSFLTALSLGSGTLLSLPAMAETAGSDRRSWQQDGLGYRARIGLLTPNDDAVPESEFWTMAPEGVSVHVGRVLLVDTRTFSDPPHPDDAIAQLAALPMQAIVFAFTTTSYVLGPDGEQALKARLEKRSNGIPVLLPCPGAVVAFRTLGVRRIALIHPPGSRTMSNSWELRTFRARDSMSFTQTKCVFAVCRLRSLPILYASLPSSILGSFTHSRAARCRTRRKPFSLPGMASAQSA